MTRRALIAAGLTALVAATAPAAAQAAAPRCTPTGQAIAHVPRSHVLATSGPLVVYRVRGANEDTLWACQRGSRTRGLVGHDDSFQSSDGEYGPSTTVGDLHLAGRWVLATIETGDDAFSECTKYQQQGCTGPIDALVLVDAATGERLTVSRILTVALSQTLTRWLDTALSPLGAVAWLTETTPVIGNGDGPSSEVLQGCLVRAAGTSLSCPGTTLSSATVDPHSLVFAGATLRWTVAGQPQSATLH